MKFLRLSMIVIPLLFLSCVASNKTGIAIKEMKIDSLSNEEQNISTKISIDTFDILTLKVVSRSAKEKTLLELYISSLP